MVDLIEDYRFETELFKDTAFILFMLRNVVYQQQITFTPNFLLHFDFSHVIDVQHLMWMVNYQSLQLGFYFGAYGTHGVFNRCEDKSFVHTLKFECIVGTEKEHLRMKTPVKQLDVDEVTGKSKMVLVKKLVGTRRVWKLKKADSGDE